MRKGMRILSSQTYGNLNLIYAEGLSTDTKPTTGLITGSKFIEIDTGIFWVFDETLGWMPRSSQQADNGKAMAARLDTIAKALQNGQGVQIVSQHRIHTLDATTLMAGAWIEAQGVPTYVDDVTDDDYAAYNLTDTGWYVFARIDAPEGSAVTANTTVTGAKAIITPEAEYVDVAVRFDVAAETVEVVIDWNGTEDDNVTERFFFKATDLAIRNLDYRTTFYVYDAAPFTTWEYVLTADTNFVADVQYYTKDENDVYTLAVAGTDYNVGDAIPADTYYRHSKVIFSGMARNVTYRCATIIDCPMEFILPEIEDETHGCWFEIRCQHAGEYSMTLTPPSADVKIATEHTQKETAGINMINLHYTVIGNTKLWRFLNTHSSIPTT